MKEPEFAPGFRLSIVDAAILAAGAGFSIVLGGQVRWAGLVVGFVVGHFFLFCNVFRISRRPEMIWAAVFTTLAGSTVFSGAPGWVMTIVVSLLLSASLIALEMRKPSYHGVFWKRINPGLKEWWTSNPSEPPP